MRWARRKILPPNLLFTKDTLDERGIFSLVGLHLAFASSITKHACEPNSSYSIYDESAINN